MRSDEQTSRQASATPLECRVVSRKDGHAWEETIHALSERSRFLCEDWTHLLETTYHYQTRIITLHEEGALVAALPLAIVKSKLTGTRAVSLPFFDSCRSYHTRDSLVPKLYDAIIDFGRREGLDYIEIRGDMRKLPDVAPSLSFYNHVVDLSGGPDTVFANLASSTRRAIRKAEKSGVEIETSTELPAMKAFYRLQCLTRQRHGLPPQPYSFFRNLHQQLIATGKGCVITALVDGKAVASGVYLTQGDLAHYKYGASDTSYQNARCNNLVMWTAFKRYSEQGYVAIDLGRNSLENEGLRKYKLSWGPTERVTHYHRYNLKTDQVMLMSDDVYGWHNKIFARLPLPVARLAGSLLYRHIA